ncbi:MAG: flagellar assembly protein FliW [Verrucomicrobiae bacterium]|nr:flagellar assembly protein FliW [Verrucomicrobiae bacterium]
MTTTATVLSSSDRLAETILTFPEGLLGFEQYRRYRLVSRPEEAPFLWLVSEPDDSSASAAPAFVVVPADRLPLRYEPILSATDCAALQLTSPADARVLLIVTVRDVGSLTINLKGPIVCNIHTGRAKQVVPVNAAEFSTQQPLPIPA